MTPEEAERAAHLVRLQLRQRNASRNHAIHTEQHNTQPPKLINPINSNG